MQFARPGGALLLLLLPLLVLLHARGGRRQGRVVPSVALWDDVPTDARGNPRRPRVPISWEFVLQAAVVVTGAVALMGPTPSGHTPVSRRVVLVAHPTLLPRVAGYATQGAFIEPSHTAPMVGARTGD